VIYSGIVYANKVVAASGANAIGGTTALLVSTANATSVAFQVTTGYSYFNNDVWAGGNLYGNGPGQPVFTRGGITNGFSGQSGTSGPGIRNYGPLYMPEGPLTCAQLNPGGTSVIVNGQLQVLTANTASGTTANFAANGVMQRGTSTIRVKEQVETIDNNDTSPLDQRILLELPESKLSKRGCHE
jgi:hypothetical protein